MKVAILSAVVAATSLEARADQTVGGHETCVATSPGHEVAPLHSARCSYTATEQAGYVAAAERWSIQVSRMVGGTKTLVRSFSGNGTSGPSPACNTKVVNPGEIVDVSVTNGVVVVSDTRPNVKVGVGDVETEVAVALSDDACPA